VLVNENFEGKQGVSSISDDFLANMLLRRLPNDQKRGAAQALCGQHERQ
jgi:hypothetical protein